MDDLSRQMASAPMVRWMEVCSKCSREITEEMNRFMMERMQRNMEMWSAFTQSGNATSFLEMQERWMTTTLRDYTSEGQKLAHMSGEIVRDCLTNMKPESGESQDIEKPVAIRSAR